MTQRSDVELPLSNSFRRGRSQIVLASLFVPDDYAEAEKPFVEAFRVRKEVQDELEAREKELVFQVEPSPQPSCPC